MKRLLAICMACVLLLGLLPTAVFAAGDVPYLNCDSDGRNWETKTCSTYTEVTSSSTSWGTWNSETWYVVNGSVTINSRITVTGAVHLILTDGCTLNANRGINVADEGNSLTIYAQSDDSSMGILNAKGSGDGAGIGGSDLGETGNNVTINGGRIIAIGGTGRYSSGPRAAGIGGGTGGEGKNITINGGEVIASGSETGGAGIGGGSGSPGSNITINGGIVFASGDAMEPTTGVKYSHGAGIGGGDGSVGSNITITGGEVTAIGSGSSAGIGGGEEGGAGSNITISGGVVEATNRENGAGIGGGSGGTGTGIIISGGTVKATSGYSGAGIGGGSGGAGTDITISGGAVEATGHTGIGGGYTGAGTGIVISGGTVTATASLGAGIGSGANNSDSTFSTGTEGNAVIFASSITDKDDTSEWSGVIFQDKDGKIYGNEMILTENMTIKNGATLTIPEGTTLTVSEGTTLTVPKGATLVNNGTLENNGTLTVNGDVEATGSLTGSGTVNKKIQTAPSAPTAQSITGDSITLNEIAGNTGTEYKCGEGEWQESTAFTGLNVGTAYIFYARYKGNEYYNISSNSAGATIYTLAAAPDASVAVIDYTVETISFGEAYEVNTAQDFAGTGISSGDSIADYIGQTLYVRFRAVEGGAPASGAASFTIPERPSAPSGKVELTKSKDSITITNTDSFTGCEFSLDGTAWNDAGKFTGLTAEEDYTVQIRAKAADGSFHSEAMDWTVTTVASDGSSNVKPGETAEVEDGTTIANHGDVVTVKKNGATTTITPSASGDVQVDSDSAVVVSGGTTVQTEDNLQITVGDQGGKVGSDGSVTTPAGGSVTVEGKSGVTTVITMSGADGEVKPSDDGKIEVPSGAAVKTADGPEITVGSQGGKVSDNGGVTVPAGGKVQVGDDPLTSITLPTGGEVKPNADGTVTVPKGSIVQTGEKEPMTLPSVGILEPSTGEVMLDVYTVTFDRQDGSAADSQTVTAGDKATRPVDPERDNYEFTGWYKESACTTAWNFDTDTVTGDTTLYAGWTLSVYTVTFDRQDGSVADSQTVTAGNRVTRPVDPERDNYEFTGWYKESACTTAWDFDTDTVTGDITLYAGWKQNDSGDNGNGGNSGSHHRPSKPSAPAEDNNDDKNKADAEKPTETENWFIDVKSGAWYYDAVRYAADHNLFSGTSDTTFSPNKAMTRGMLVTVLYRMAGEPELTDENLGNSFADVNAGAYYAAAVDWAQANGIVSGYGDGTFRPDASVTREQLAAILYHYSDSPSTDGALDSFADGNAVSRYALDALRWAVGQGIISGKGSGVLDPRGQATRAEVAAMLMQFCKMNEK